MTTIDHRYIKSRRWETHDTRYVPSLRASGVYSYTDGLYLVGQNRSDWKTVVDACKSATNSLSKERVAISYEPTITRGTIKSIGGCSNRGKYRETSRDTGPVAGTRATAEIISKADAFAAVNALRKIAKLQESYSGQTILGELRETVSMLRSPLKDLRERSGVFWKKSKALKATHSKKDWAELVSSSWLEFSFGVKPLLADIQSVLDAINNLQLGQCRPVRAVGRFDSPSTDVISVYSDTIGSQVTRRISRASTVFVIYVCGVREIDNTDHSALRRVLDQSGVTDLRNLVPTAYELIPWSWLVDYFTNLGQVLGASFVSTRDVAWSSKTVVEKSFAQRYAPSIKGITDTSCTTYEIVEPGSSMFSGEYITRTSITPKISVNALTLRMPGFATQWLNLAAISPQLFRR